MSADKRSNRCPNCKHTYASMTHRTHCKGMSRVQARAGRSKRSTSHIARGSWSVFDAAVPQWVKVINSDFPNDQRDEYKQFVADAAVSEAPRG